MFVGGRGDIVVKQRVALVRLPGVCPAPYECSCGGRKTRARNRQHLILSSPSVTRSVIFMFCCVSQLVLTPFPPCSGQAHLDGVQTVSRGRGWSAGWSHPRYRGRCVIIPFGGRQVVISGLRRGGSWICGKMHFDTGTPELRPSTFVRPRLRVDVFLCSLGRYTHTRFARTPGGRAEDDVSRHGLGLGTERRDLRRHPCAQVGSVRGGVGRASGENQSRLFGEGKFTLNCFFVVLARPFFPLSPGTGKRGILQAA